ncbi:MAG TPA: DUF1295 domain-containing protein [Puia sp.]|nr:DUF1295 domain-containing protein [Puia sp.]
MNTDHWILLGAWTFFSLLHSLTAAEWFQEISRSVMGRWFMYYRLFYSLFAFFTLAEVLIWQFSITSPMLGPFAVLKWLVGMPAGILGMALMGASIRKYFFNLSGVAVFWKKNAGKWQRPGQTASLRPGTAHHPGEVEILEVDGLHRHIRHPLYLGTLLLVWSLFLFFPLLSNLLSCGMITLYTLAGIRLEERKLLLQFGEPYASYQKKVPMLIPGLRRAS